MNEIDKKLYELFYDGFDWYINWDYPPELHDVFRVAKERQQPYDIAMYYYDDFIIKIYDCHTYKDEDKIIPGYNITKSLMSQTDSTKQTIVDLFSN